MSEIGSEIGNEQEMAQFAVETQTDGGRQRHPVYKEQQFRGDRRLKYRLT